MDAAALPAAAGVDAPETAVVDAGTVVYDRSGAVSHAPVFARLADGRRVVADCPEEDLAARAGTSLVGETVRIEGTPPIYRA